MGIKSYYEPPEVSVVEPRPSEAVLQACKMEDNGATHGGPASGDDDCRVATATCFDLGS